MAKSNRLFERRQKRSRYKIKRQNEQGAHKLRLSVFRSNQHTYAQIIDDDKGLTLVAASTVDKQLKGKLRSGSNKEAAKQVGSLVAERAKKAGIGVVVFDRGGYPYHGRVKELADAARAGGLQF